MKKKIYASFSFNKRYSMKNKITSSKNSNINLSPNNKDIFSSISKIYYYYYTYNFSSILKVSKISFLEKIDKLSKEAISSIIKNNSSYNNQYSDNIKENLEKKYDEEYQILSTSYNNFINETEKFEYITHFRKHCPNTESIALHSCSNKTQGKFILIQSKNTKISYSICINCKQCYKSDFILMLCNSCNKKYYSNILPKNEDSNILPATWEKYHCKSMFNEIMKCIKCRNILYLDLDKKKLICKNKNCNFISEPESIVWTCAICNEDFHSKAKVYNPLEFKILNKTIDIALLIQKKAYPKELPCRCCKDTSKLDFYHKEHCKGLLYQGMLIDKEVIICSKCHSINFEEKFNWICPLCKAIFHLHSVKGSRPFSKKKYIMNRKLYNSEKKSTINNIDYIKKDNYIEKRINNNIRTMNLNKNDNKSDYLFNSNINNEKDNNLNSKRKSRHYSTLKEILTERESSQSKNIHKINIDINNSDESKISSQIININKNLNLYNEALSSQKVKIKKYIKSYFEDNNDVKSQNNKIEKDKNKRNINKDLKLEVSPFVVYDTPKETYKFGSKPYISTEISANKFIYSENNKDKRIVNPLNKNLFSFNSSHRKTNPIVGNYKDINSFKDSNLNENKIRFSIKDFNNNEKIIKEENNLPLRFSAGNNHIYNQIKNINNFNINININTSPYKNEEINENFSRNIIEEKLNYIIEEKTKLGETKIQKKNYTLEKNDICISKYKLDVLSKNSNIPIFQESDYTFINAIGEGIYGEVHLVENNMTLQQYAIKKIICRDYNDLIKKKNEFELLSSLNHENILRILGINFKYLDETTGLILVLMELACNDWNSEIKKRILAKKYYKENELIIILKQIVKGLLFLQKNNIAHRDIKPQNILVFPNNIYKIADFGEAKNIESQNDKQLTLRGSELYMSPLLYQSFKLNQKNVVHNPYKSDVFSLGYCLLYAICLNLRVLENVRELNSIKEVINTLNEFTSNKYSEKFMKIIYGMIEPNEKIRFDFEDLSKELDKI